MGAHTKGSNMYVLHILQYIFVAQVVREKNGEQHTEHKKRRTFIASKVKMLMQ